MSFSGVQATSEEKLNRYKLLTFLPIRIDLFYLAAMNILS